MAAKVTSEVKTFARGVLPAWLWTRLRALWLLPQRRRNEGRVKRQQEDAAHFLPRQVSHTYGGFRLDVYIADPVSQQWYDQDWEELPELTLLRQHKLRTGSRVFDIGAHQCVVAMMLAKVAGSEGFVLAVEANPHNAAVGKKNAELNHVGQLHILQAAVAERRGRIIINELLNGAVDDGASGLGKIEVAAYSVDDLTREYGSPDVLFIDVEGYECAALQGARETLKGRPDCFVEVHTQGGLEAYGGSVEEVVSFFPPSDYDLHIASDTQHNFVPFSPDSPLLRERFFLVAISR